MELNDYSKMTEYITKLFPEEPDMCTLQDMLRYNKILCRLCGDITYTRNKRKYRGRHSIIRTNT